MKKNRIIPFMVILIIGFILVDQISKIIIKSQYESPIGNGIIGISVIQNTGMAFGFHSGNTKNMVLTTLILLIIINFIRTQKERIDPKTAVAISLILAGGISNLIDRILRGGILDFIRIQNFAIFNIADCYIVLGWILMIIFLIQFNREK